MRYSYESDAISLSWAGNRDSQRVETIKDFEKVWNGLDSEVNIQELDKNLAENILEKLDIENSDEGFNQVIQFLEANDNREDKSLTNV